VKIFFALTTPYLHGESKRMDVLARADEEGIQPPENLPAAQRAFVEFHLDNTRLLASQIRTELELVTSHFPGDGRQADNSPVHQTRAAICLSHRMAS
jgi:hypothetical protein